MSLNINSESKNIKRSSERKYGNLVINTTIKDEMKVIDLSSPIQGTVPQNSESSAKQTKDMSIRNKIDTRLSTSILRGQKVSINSKTENLSKLLIALDWEANYKGKHELDLDTSIFMVDGNGNTSEENFIFYGNPKSRDGGVVIGSDYNLGLKRAYDEVMQLNLDLVSRNIEKLAITLTVYDGDKRNQSFKLISNAHLRIIDGQTKKEILNYNFDEGLKYETAIVITEIYRYRNEWKLNPVGNGFNGGLQALCENYGIKTK